MCNFISLPNMIIHVKPQVQAPKRVFGRCREGKESICDRGEREGRNKGSYRGTTTVEHPDVWRTVYHVDVYRKRGAGGLGIKVMRLTVGVGTHDSKVHDNSQVTMRPSSIHTCGRQSITCMRSARENIHVDKLFKICLFKMYMFKNRLHPICLSSVRF